MHRLTTIGVAVALVTGPVVGAPIALADAGVGPVTPPITGGGTVGALPPTGVSPNRLAPAPPAAAAPAARPQAQMASGTPMNGQFVVASGSCGSGPTPQGSYFRMLDPSGGTVNNGNSPCSDKSATPLQAGTQGLLGGRMQPFSASPGSSNAIVAPATFFGSPFAVATDSPDHQSGHSAPAPQILNNGGTLAGQVQAFQAYYNGSYYNQGAPKPDGSTPGSTTNGVSGTYNPSTGAFTLDWKSTITGGAFNNFTGVWHLVGTYNANGAPAGSGGGGAAPAPGSPASTGSAPGTTPSTSGGSPATLAFTGPTTNPVLALLLVLAGLAGLAWRRTRATDSW